MRKSIILAFFICTSIFSISSQEHYSANISIGIKAGGSLSQTMFSPGISQKMLPGIMGGAAVRYIEENHFGIIAELNYVQRGWKEDFKEAPYSFQRELSYLQIPLLAHIYFGGKRVKFFFNAGPEVGFLLSNRSKSNFDVSKIDELPDFPAVHRNTKQFTMAVKNKIDYGISAGLGLELNINPKNSFILEGRFYYGLNNIFDSNKKDVFAASNGISVMVSLGYMFRVK